jgi:hypothetical protein
MKVLLALTIILGGVLITKNSFAQSKDSITADAPVYVSGVNYNKYPENAEGKYKCPLDAQNAAAHKAHLKYSQGAGNGLSTK